MEEALGHFKILEKIGSGGMGEVVRARDRKLGRDVALKVLPPSLSQDPDALSRFRREAHVLASLNHHHIAAIYGLEEDHGRHFLVMELVEGEDLAARLARGPMGLREALDVFHQVAGALEVAHGQGIVHRDLKPANIKLRTDGMVKVLDFGLAKLVDEDPTELAETVASASRRTSFGALLGTPAYMSPEQARGEPIDARGDLWSLGCSLFEALTGRPVFAGRTFAETIAAVMTKEPAWDALPAGTPPNLRRLLQALLNKDRDGRVRSARDVRDEISRALEREHAPAVEPAPLPRHLTQVTYSDATEESPAWSPDGRELLFARQVGSVRKICRQRLDSGESLSVTRGGCDDCQPTWHPTEERALFVRSREPGRRLEPGDVYGEHTEAADVWELDLVSGREKLLIENAYNPAYSPDGRRIAVDASWGGPRRIWVTDLHGRNPEQVTGDTSEAVVHIWPRWSPDGACIVFQNNERTQYNIRVVQTANRSMHWLTRDLVPNIRPCWAPSGHSVLFSSYRSGGMNLWKVPVDSTGAAAGGLQQVTAGPGQDLDVAISSDGRRLAFCILRQNASLWRLPVSHETGRPNGPPAPVISSTREDSRGAWSPDDRRIAFNSDRGGEMNLWLHDISEGSIRRLTRGGGGDYQPSWSPDGRALVFFSSRAGSPGIWKLSLESLELTSLSPAGTIEVNPFFSPDGRRIAYQSDRDGRLEVWVMNADGSSPRALTAVGVRGHFLRWSRDGEWILFRRDTGEALVHRVRVEGGDLEPLGHAVGGSHLSLSPDETKILDVLAHKELWVSPVAGGAPEKVFEFEDPEVRIDYPVWSHRGEAVLFDRFRPKGGDIWVMENEE